MKIKEGFILKEIAGSFVIVPVGEEQVDFNLMVTLNDTGAFLWNQLLLGKSEEEIADAMTSEYQVDKQTAAADMKEFFGILLDKGILES